MEVPALRMETLPDEARLQTSVDRARHRGRRFYPLGMYKAYTSAKNDLSSILNAPLNALKAAWSGISSAASSVTDAVTSPLSSAVATVQNVSAGNAAANQITAMNSSAYAPGGVTYNYIAATQGQAAADAAWQTVQNQPATEDSQAVTWNPLTWL